MYITSDQFLDAFSEEWHACISEDRQGIWDKYQGDKTWTEFMQPYDGFLDHVGQRLSKATIDLTYFKEIYSIDAAYAGGVDLFRSGLCYPSEMHVLLEHENGPNIEEEMWKLLQWRCPLKVLIFYDYPEAEEGSNDLSKWATEKLAKLLQMRQKSIAFIPEAAFVTYLFVIGQTTLDNTIRWWWTTDKLLGPIALDLDR